MAETSKNHSALSVQSTSWTKACIERNSWGITTYDDIRSKEFTRRGAELAEGIRGYSASFAPLREMFSWSIDVQIEEVFRILPIT
jgi:hypothetical protein